MKFTLQLIAMLSLMVVFTTCKTKPDILKNTLHDFNRADFIGIVYDSKNRPCQGAVVQVKGEKASYRTDIDGRFVLPNLLQGTHYISVAKEEFEPQEIFLDFTSRKQILYVQLVSQESLLDICESMLSKLEWRKAGEILERAKKINADNSRFLALEGAFSYRIGQYDSALANWMALLEKGHKDPYLYLMIADTYQYGLENIRKSSAWLRRYLKTREDETIRKRLDVLTEEPEE